MRNAAIAVTAAADLLSVGCAVKADHRFDLVVIVG